MSSWFTADPTSLLAVALSAVAVFAILIGLVRLVGLRSFSKMTSVDFAMTIATGSILATVVLSESPSLPRAAAALVSLFMIQMVVSWLRKHTSWAERVFDNEPVVLMSGNRMLTDNLRKTRVTENDVWAKLREANVLDPSEVRAVVLETTGDISVLHGDPAGTALHPCLLRGVRESDRVELGEDDYTV